MEDSIITFTGKLVKPFELRAKDVDIRDIAHALSLKCRFTCHTREFYSVAQHSILVADECLPEYRIHGLLHDAAEAYLPDIATTIKHRFPTIAEAEKRILDAIYEKFELDKLSTPERMLVKHMDNALTQREGRVLMPHHPGASWMEGKLYSQEIDIIPWASDVAEANFLNMFIFLQREKQ